MFVSISVIMFVNMSKSVFVNLSVNMRKLCTHECKHVET